MPLDLDSLVKIAERTGPLVTPLAGVLVFANVYFELTPARAEYVWLSPIMAIFMTLSGATFFTKLIIGWPKIPGIDN